MARISVDPDQLQLLSTQMRQTADDLRSIATRLGGALSNLDFEARQREGIESNWISARTRLQTAAEGANILAHYLAAKAIAFEDADRYSLAALEDAIHSSPPSLLLLDTPTLTYKRENDTEGD